MLPGCLAGALTPEASGGFRFPKATGSPAPASAPASGFISVAIFARLLCHDILLHHTSTSPRLIKHPLSAPFSSPRLLLFAIPSIFTASRPSATERHHAWARPANESQAAHHPQRDRRFTREKEGGSERINHHLRDAVSAYLVHCNLVVFCKLLREVPASSGAGRGQTFLNTTIRTIAAPPAIVAEADVVEIQFTHFPGRVLPLQSYELTTRSTGSAVTLPHPPFIVFLP